MEAVADDGHLIAPFLDDEDGNTCPGDATPAEQKASVVTLTRLSGSSTSASKPRAMASAPKAPLAVRPAMSCSGS
ncbi:hypothetical protein RAH32_14320 [Paracoccus sp. WLY502]|uniref:hypothetical protein n=1 Tax=Paracoccus yibinensis TaxID=3068891 RepID=UPI0027969A75|nr:hypothetical protein [Paracoccus sp. WLY502]MDQ1901616.1 hypothetical protein [Paracoccus sp. WLY502]